MIQRTLHRSVAGLAVLVGAALLVSGCQSPPERAEAGSGCAPSGPASQSVSATGDLFAVPEVDFPAGLSPLTTERTILVEGSGEEIAQGDLVTLDFVAYNGRTGEQLEVTGYGADGVGRTVITLDSTNAMPGLRRALLCAPAGSRIAAVVPAADAYGSTVTPRGLDAGDPLIMVIDVVSLASDRAEGSTVEALPGFPDVTESQDGKPVIGVPLTAAPPELAVQQVIVGTGPAVRPGSDVLVKYVGVLWRTGLSFADTWINPARTPVSLETLLPGVAQAIIGQPVGSRVVVVVPPALGYGPDGDVAAGVSGSDTLVFAVDILAST
ncbi:FKBP-type peptidyl-prolyl cis-trans isomerase [Salinibacterium hongtaonis]|uniref:peptidylprolyl isomerase n=1 Tax=Homoserinimonas hongtaonis TaxID=2079791 RepID=A0A2U1SXI5_9MICO|nr:FKBP-type peptidyl-prolyl cis-trans isomerase [Salinibacterium hongtaonis]PWB96253.1 peptidylprolyl isomerase [Salinibacterium hongtaonis]